MQDAPGANCGCGKDDHHEHVAHLCSACGSPKEWVSHGPSAVVFECPDCN